MSRLTPKQKQEVVAQIDAFPTSAFNSHLSPGILTYYKSALGRDYKLLAQMALFVIWDYLGNDEQQVWLAMCKVIQFRIKLCYVSLYRLARCPRFRGGWGGGVCLYASLCR